jgi:hypothetical protein
MKSPLLTLSVIAQELWHLCAEPDGPFWVIEGYTTSSNLRAITIRAGGHEVSHLIKWRNCIMGPRFTLEKFSEKHLVPIAQSWLGRKGVDVDYERWSRQKHDPCFAIRGDDPLNWRTAVRIGEVRRMLG